MRLPLSKAPPPRQAVAAAVASAFSCCLYTLFPDSRRCLHNENQECAQADASVCSEERCFHAGACSSTSSPLARETSSPETQERAVRPLSDAIPDSWTLTPTGIAIRQQPSICKLDPGSPLKREDGVLSWDDYFIALAFLSAQRSKDPNKQVGACVVSQGNIILSIGYNGFPRGIRDDDLPWAKLSQIGEPLDTKYPYVVHAEANAILNANTDKMSGQRIYVTMYPCNECAKLIIQAGLREVIYSEAKDLGLTQATWLCRVPVSRLRHKEL
eukprot:TRINITY_DN12762_c0_g1_i3.p1 TRINITY_DN12762_c0_g1~~TRINITY_DN12762_c0_g1_i3.p1  ORF type:complete len:278 (-),score=20.93 TRINITY_DN12762_c0_g1_i3:13-825(-)